MPKNYWDILQNCMDVAVDRGKSYGEVSNNLKCTAAILYESFGVKLLPSQIIMVMIAIKTGREKHKHKKDNIVDLINYYAILEYLLSKKL